MRQLDWSWKPTPAVREALRRGQQKYRRLLTEQIAQGKISVQPRRMDSAAMYEIRSYFRQEEVRRQLGYGLAEPLITVVQ